MTFENTLLNALGEYLDSAGAGLWDPDTPYQPTDTAITTDTLPLKVDKAIVMTLYPVQDEGTTDSIVGLQLRIRGKPNDRTSSKTILDNCFDALHGLQDVELGGIPVIWVWRQSGANLGPDSSDRLEHTANYYLQLTREGTHRNDD